MNGLVTFRAYGKTKFYKQVFLINVEKGANATYSNAIIQRWLSFRLDLTIMFFSISTAIFVVAFKGKIDPGLSCMIL